MSWQVNDAEFTAVLDLPAPRRYEYFVKRAASYGRLWGLRGGGGWVIAEDDDRRSALSGLASSRFARRWPRESGATPRRWRSTLTNGWRNGFPISRATGYALPCSKHPLTKGSACRRND